ncbi:hypothetical protein D3C84_1225430 [compost metagenome]
MLIIDPATGAMFDLPEKAGATMKPVVEVASAQPAGPAQAMPREQWRQQQLQQLQQQNLSYEEYQSRYRQIMTE